MLVILIKGSVLCNAVQYEDLAADSLQKVSQFDTYLIDDFCLDMFPAYYAIYLKLTSEYVTIGTVAQNWRL
jgi:hypothetical protein